MVFKVEDSKIQNLWDATYVQNGAEIMVDAIESTAVIEPKDSVVFGFCGVTTGPRYGAAVVSVSAVE
jgi:cellulase/cellobiase CelA1